MQKLDTIEKVMVDPQRKSVRDVLRNPAGLNDTLFDMIAMTTTADMAPTEQTKAVSREVMAKVDSEVAKFEALVKGDIAQLDKALAKARIRTSPSSDASREDRHGLHREALRPVARQRRRLDRDHVAGRVAIAIAAFVYFRPGGARRERSTDSPLSLRRDRASPPRGPRNSEPRRP